MHLFPGADNRFELYEDDGESQAYCDGGFADDPVPAELARDSLEFRITPATGDLAQIPAPRTYRIVVHGIRQPDAVNLTVDGASQPAESEYDAANETMTLGPLDLRPTEALTLTLAAAGTLISRRDRRLETCQRLLKAFRLETEAKRGVHNDLPKLLTGAASLQAHGHAVERCATGRSGSSASGGVKSAKSVTIQPLPHVSILGGVVMTLSVTVQH